MSYDKKNLTFVLQYYWIYQTRCEKEIKCSASLAFYLFSSTRLINSIKHEHSCKILYIFNWMRQYMTRYVSKVNAHIRLPYSDKFPHLSQGQIKSNSIFSIYQIIRLDYLNLKIIFGLLEKKTPRSLILVCHISTYQKPLIWSTHWVWRPSHDNIIQVKCTKWLPRTC